MAETTAIGWCDATVNFHWGCTKVSAACDHCYAETWAKRLGKDLWGAGKPREPVAGAAALAFKLERRAVKRGIRIRVFSNSMSDFFDAEIPDAWRDEAMAVIALTPHLDWLVLTKRAKVMREYMTRRLTPKIIGAARDVIIEVLGDGAARALGETSFRLTPSAEVSLPLDNLWLGVTAEDQKMADLRIPELLATPAAKRFVSCEPLLGPVDLRRWIHGHHPTDMEEAERDFGAVGRLDWVIAGGESGAQARPMHPDWVRALRDQCLAAQVPFFFKQWGEWLPGQNDPHPSATYPEGTPQSIAHWQDGGWGPRDTKNPRRNYVMWDEQGVMHPGGSRTYENLVSVAAWAARVGRKAAGNVLDGAIWDQFPRSGRP